MINQKAILLFVVLINVLFSAFELYFGNKQNSLGIISDAVHIFFDTLSIILGVASLWLNPLQKAIKTPIKLVNLDDILSLVQCSLLFFTSCQMIFSSVSHLINGSEVNSENIVFLSILSLIVNLISLGVTHKISHTDHSCTQHTLHMENFEESHNEHNHHSHHHTH